MTSIETLPEKLEKKEAPKSVADRPIIGDPLRIEINNLIQLRNEIVNKEIGGMYEEGKITQEGKDQLLTMLDSQIKEREEQLARPSLEDDKEVDKVEKIKEIRDQIEALENELVKAEAE
ncbi:MAG: hypothetical protein COV29_01170 [Candidatus Yanofskybacteria bacterium CG10_big_fil_rev_8_21_14_0_10_36_16]|uniref:Uncharacterized protein n=1 Tax=Candidatus Yanofskybacteria bacterium CG10_big_fil_rev_8_21_14_0_10_36_16 TaxID=1975096 RepID=A0A2J0Q8J2_9BACT|nr:MAG: hypothetical protein COV29_01170 [Candidatus Yanofskybacteria bacterium CG10_big_fil_rev_8_21_14_0_10_36_16]